MGGSSGGGRGLTRRELEVLKDTAKEKLKEKAQPRRNVFLSFAGEDLDDVNLIRGQAKNDNIEFEFSDRSLKTPFDSDDAEYIRRGIRERIKQASVTLVYLSEDSASSKWVDWEIRESQRQSKGVIGVYGGDSPPSNLPPAAKEFGIRTVSWKARDIAEAIERAAQERNQG